MMNRFAVRALLLLVASVAGCNVPDQTGSSGVDRSEDAPKGNLGAIRSALSIYYGDMEGQYPSDLAALTLGGKYLAAIPPVAPANLHPATSAVRNGAKPTDEGGWLYNNAATDANVGNVLINCTHTDAKGSPWTMY